MLGCNTDNTFQGNDTVPVSMREASPGSDDSGATSASSCSVASSSAGVNGGNLVQKQIERLYGGKERIVPVRLTHQSSTGSSTTTSPPAKELEKSFEGQYHSEATPAG